jgi:hypothetical protein
MTIAIGIVSFVTQAQPALEQDLSPRRTHEKSFAAGVERFKGVA